MSTLGNNPPYEFTSIETFNSKTLDISFNRSPEADGSPWKFTCNFGNLPNLDSVTDIKLVTCVISNTVPNVSGDIGNLTFSLDFSIAGVFTYVFEPGFYSFATIASILQTAINAFIAPSTAVFDLDPAGYARIVITGAETVKNNVNNILGNTLGFITLGAFLPSLNAEVLPKLQGASCFRIHSNKLSTNYCLLNSVTGNNQSSSCIFSVPVNAPYGSNVIYSGQPLHRTIIGKRGISMKNFDIELRDENGRLLTDMDPRSVVEISLKIGY